MASADRDQSACQQLMLIHPSLHPPIHPSIHPPMPHSQPRTQPASCVRAHLGTVHVCSRRRGLARNPSRASRAFANRLAGIWEQEWRKREREKSTKKKCGKTEERGGWQSRAIWGEERRLSEGRCGIKFLDGNYPKHSVHRSSSCAAMSD